MVEFGIGEYLVENFALIFIVLCTNTYLKHNFGLKVVALNFGASILCAIFSMILEDAAYLPLVLGAIIVEIVRQKKLKIDPRYVNLMLISVIIQIILISISGYISTTILMWANLFHSIKSLSRVGDMLVFQDITIDLFFTILLFIWFYRHRVCWRHSMNQIEDLGLSTRIFWMLMMIYGSIQTILIISDIQDITAIIQAASIVIFMLIIILMSWQMQFFIKTYAAQQNIKDEGIRNQQLHDYLASIEQQYAELRQFKHDYQNVMLSMTELVKHDDRAELQEYLNELKNKKQLNESLSKVSISELDHLKNETLRGLIIQKFFEARKRGVELDLEIEQEDLLIEKQLVDIVRIVGVLLDNAIEQAEKMPDHKVSCALIKTDDTVEISVENTVTLPFNLQKIFERGYSSKGSNRGLGLANVKELVNQNPNFYLDTQLIQQKLRITLIITGEK
ncbi:sensor histidine kinase [Pediococcus ethanolidurans]|uniref:sensor histidine kinase n=1 Tax=Pediococcus ethanolidurans TaxID=319653 RepID=UPI001C1EFEEA|nr:GHKL domain-containing protein [Pediococcus ethanolidurans]MBU7555845.1 GHKL domain-containing protein [Pediococcus ethanolidurans]MBU7563569.1 GHKL domain-containing protein [Pediococcus ethanolidurans]MCT4398077.1 GHKL domain-containing protein [Pediococcus ethanolidurans]MCV3322553.1 GHKL domain-containing protein [Pediococcus ethanolidurans]MCV3324622.1 GHKL domain-containing protein [Pediococcus ethanolidurans]